MHSVYLIFDQETVNPEDDEVRRYLAEHRLVPKSQSKTKWEDRDSEVMYFGGCYLRGHMTAIADLQREAIEREILADQITGLLREGPDAKARSRVALMGDDELGEVSVKLAERYHSDSSFEQDDEGALKITVDAPKVQRRFLDLVDGDSMASIEEI